MNLPNAPRAVVELRKLIEYALDLDSPRGRHKARVFKAALGITLDDAEVLRDLILKSVIAAERRIGELDFYGQRYSVSCKIEFGEKVPRSKPVGSYAETKISQG